MGSFLGSAAVAVPDSELIFVAPAVYAADGADAARLL